MFSQKSHQSLSRRGSKLLVEMVIGVIGILGIMLAQFEGHGNDSLPHGLKSGGEAGSGETIGTHVVRITPEIDWSEILF